MSKNNNLRTAKKNKNDEFYTQYADIEKELRFYTESFKGKVVYCNCDDYQESNFYKYFYYNFHYLKLKKLICTCFNVDGKGLYAIYDGETEVAGKLNGDGDFRSEECIEYLKECDVVVTNPPFSLFRQYIKQLMDYGKKFIVMANNNAITYKEFFPYIKNGKVWLGRTLFTGKMPYFKVSDAYNLTNDRFEKREDGLYKQVNGICWFTNVPNDNNRQVLDLYKRYSFEDYPKYDNYDAINVDKVADIPMDYDGVIGIPITGLKYLWSDGTIHTEYNSTTTQFEIIALGNSRENFTPNKDYIKPIKVLKDGKKVNGNAINCVLAIESKTKPINMIYYTSENVPYLIAPYARILIKKKDDLTTIPAQFEIIDARAIALNDKQKNKSTYLIKDADGAINGKPTYARICIKKKDDLTPIPTQFEIIGLMSGAKDSSLINGNDGRAKFYINGKGVYARILIRKIRK